MAKPGDIWRSDDGSMELRLGRYQDTLAGEACDAVIVDAPYSEKTHASHSPTTSVLTACKRDARWAAAGGVRRHINYKSWDSDDICECVASLSARCRGWFISLTDDVLAPVWASAMRDLGRHVFAPLPCVSPGSRVRLTGDGPSSWTVWAVAGRTKAQVKWGTLPGAYWNAPEPKPVIGGKDLALIRAIVRDYSRPGDLICDPCAGGGTTLLAAHLEGRRSIGAELDCKTFDLAVERLRGLGPHRAEGQQNLWGPACRST